METNHCIFSLQTIGKSDTTTKQKLKTARIFSSTTRGWAGLHTLSGSQCLQSQALLPGVGNSTIRPLHALIAPADLEVRKADAIMIGVLQVGQLLP